MSFKLRLYEDVLPNGGEAALPALPRMIFVVHGSLAVADRMLNDGEAWSGEGAVMLKAGSGGATVWRWELVAGDAASGLATGKDVVSREKLSAELATVPKGALLLRGDSVAFPPGGCAYLHRHQGPGIRCLLEGGIRIDTHGRSTFYGPGGAWYETGPDPRLRPSHRPADALHPRHGAAARLSGQKLGRVSQRGRQGQAEVAAV